MNQFQAVWYDLGVDPFLISLLALVFGTAGLCSSVYVVVRYDPADVFRRLETCEDSAPWSIAKQELAAWTVATEEMLDQCEIKLKKAHQRKGGRPRKDAQQLPDLPDAAMGAPMSRQQELDQVKAQLGLRAV